MDTQGRHAGSLKRTGIDKTSSDIAVLGPLVRGPTEAENIKFFFYFLVGIRSSGRGQHSEYFV